MGGNKLQKLLKHHQGEREAGIKYCAKEKRTLKEWKLWYFRTCGISEESHDVNPSGQSSPFTNPSNFVTLLDLCRKVSSCFVCLLCFHEITIHRLLHLSNLKTKWFNAVQKKRLCNRRKMKCCTRLQDRTW